MGVWETPLFLPKPPFSGRDGGFGGSFSGFGPILKPKREGWVVPFSHLEMCQPDDLLFLGVLLFEKVGLSQGVLTVFGALLPA